MALLVGAPLATLIGFGSYYLWSAGFGFVMGWFLAGSLALASLLAWHWQRQQRLLRVDFTPQVHWTDRDRQAWLLVEARAKKLTEHKASDLIAWPFFTDTAQSMALELARFYHPGADDPVGSLTIPEILAVVELAAHDLAEMVDEYLPGGHLLTVNDLRRVKKVADWYPVVNNISWVISSLFSPVNTAFRLLASQAGMNRPWQLLQDNVVLWLATAYVNRMGRYLIDLNSGRLRVGAQRFRELQSGAASAETPSATEEDPAEQVRTVTFALIGQTKTGKSSVINALLGEQRALTDVMPATAAIQRYELQPPEVPTRFILLDTVGYGNEGPREDQKRATEEAARQADVILLVLHARNPARQADVELLESLQLFFAQNPELRRPPVLAVMTHIDLLAPALEWAPPYNWQEPQRPKEQSVHDAVAAVREQLGAFVHGIIPVCTAPGRVYGVEEWLLPGLVGVLDQAHAVAWLRCLKAEADRGKIRKVFYQLLAAGKSLLQIATRPVPSKDRKA